jgi:hypothetical protein
MARSKSKYDPLKIDKLKHLIISHHQKGLPKEFEIFVDEMRVVDRTSDPEEFDSFHDYLDEETRYIRIILYYSPNSPRNEQFVFEFQNNKSFSSNVELSGVDIDHKIGERIYAERLKWETEQKQKEQQKEIESLSAKLKEAEDYITTLENNVEDLKVNGTKLKAGWGEIASVALEGIIRRNPQILSAIPGGEAVAGILAGTEQSQKAIETDPQAEVSFQSVPSPTPTNSLDSDSAFIIQMMKESFEPNQIAKVWEILRELAENPNSIETVLELLQTS